MAYYESIGKSNEWYTPKYIFNSLGSLFDMDVAASNKRYLCNVPARTFITENSLQSDWKGYVWCNPPFGGRNELYPWVEKIINHNNGILLTPDRTSTKWWKKAAEGSIGILFIQPKVKFIRQDGTVGNSPSTGTCLFGYGEKAIIDLKEAEKKELGILLIKNIKNENI